MSSDAEGRDEFDRNVESFSADGVVDHYVRRTEKGLFEKERRAIDRYFTESGARVLDVGCGTGRTTKPLHDRGFDVTGIDVSAGMIRAGQELFPEIDFRVDDATDLEFDDETFDYVLFAHNGIDYVHPESDRLRTLRELRRVLRPGGVIVFSTHNAWYRFPAAFRDRGFLKTFYLRNGNLRRLFDRYKMDDLEEEGLLTYLTSPPNQRRQLRACDLDPVELVSERPAPTKFFEAMLYYVARR